MTFRKSTRLNGSRTAIVLRSNANVTPDAVPGAPFVQFEKPQQPLRFFFYIKKLDILMSSFPVYLQYYLINDTADGSVIGVVASRTGIIFIDSITGPAVIMVVVKVRTDVSG